MRRVGRTPHVLNDDGGTGARIQAPIDLQHSLPPIRESVIVKVEKIIQWVAEHDNGWKALATQFPGSHGLYAGYGQSNDEVVQLDAMGRVFDCPEEAKAAALLSLKMATGHKHCSESCGDWMRTEYLIQPHPETRAAMDDWATLTCPSCGHTEWEQMPASVCLNVYECLGCAVLLKPRAGDCCVFCSYADKRCPTATAPCDS
jgi:hypothetical protein